MNQDKTVLNTLKKKLKKLFNFDVEFTDNVFKDEGGRTFTS